MCITVGPHCVYNRSDDKRHSGMLFQTDSDLKLDGKNNCMEYCNTIIGCVSGEIVDPNKESPSSNDM